LFASTGVCTSEITASAKKRKKRDLKMLRLKLKHGFIYFVAIVASGLLRNLISNWFLYIAVLFGLGFFVIFCVKTLEELDEAIWKKESRF